MDPPHSNVTCATTDIADALEYRVLDERQTRKQVRTQVMPWISPLPVRGDCCVEVALHISAVPVELGIYSPTAPVERGFSTRS